jgi:hypothetical protein
VAVGAEDPEVQLRREERRITRTRTFGREHDAVTGGDAWGFGLVQPLGEARSPLPPGKPRGPAGPTRRRTRKKWGEADKATTKKPCRAGTPQKIVAMRSEASRPKRGSDDRQTEGKNGNR